eukprot:Phypoly_transcript_01252.p1 GENE.Phypoly_transcript_01252~~Phypoly_transcript_01252.p1  ORF type:complete len:706 (+),score=133.32 Phypoly_transcript_01252:1279-3396(+)
MDKVTTLFVNNLASHIIDEQLKALFSPYGEILKCRVVRHLQTLESRGFAFVEYAEREACIQAMNKLNGTDFFGEKLTVTLARPLDYRNRVGPTRGFPPVPGTVGAGRGRGARDKMFPPPYPPFYPYPPAYPPPPPHYRYNPYSRPYHPGYDYSYYSGHYDSYGYGGYYDSAYSAYYYGADYPKAIEGAHAAERGAIHSPQAQVYGAPRTDAVHAPATARAAEEAKAGDATYNYGYYGDSANYWQQYQNYPAAQSSSYMNYTSQHPYGAYPNNYHYPPENGSSDSHPPSTSSTTTPATPVVSSLPSTSLSHTSENSHPMNVDISPSTSHPSPSHVNPPPVQNHSTPASQVSVLAASLDMQAAQPQSIQTQPTQSPPTYMQPHPLQNKPLQFQTSHQAHTQSVQPQPSQNQLVQSQPPQNQSLQSQPPQNQSLQSQPLQNQPVPQITAQHQLQSAQLAQHLPTQQVPTQAEQHLPVQSTEHPIQHLPTQLEPTQQSVYLQHAQPQPASQLQHTQPQPVQHQLAHPLVQTLSLHDQPLQPAQAPVLQSTPSLSQSTLQPQPLQHQLAQPESLQSAQPSRSLQYQSVQPQPASSQLAHPLQLKPTHTVQSQPIQQPQLMQAAQLQLAHTMQLQHTVLPQMATQQHLQQLVPALPLTQPVQPESPPVDLQAAHPQSTSPSAADIPLHILHRLPPPPPPRRPPPAPKVSAQ